MKEKNNELKIYPEGATGYYLFSAGWSCGKAENSISFDKEDKIGAVVFTKKQVEMIIEFLQNNVKNIRERQ